MSIFNKLFGRQKNNQAAEQTSEKKTLPTLDEFTKLSSQDRMGLIMTLGDTGKSEYFPFIKYAILNDSNLHVKLAAFKRIHLFKDNPEVVSMLTEIKNNGDEKEFEPYFSMALSRLGIITMEEFEEMINNPD